MKKNMFRIIALLVLVGSLASSCSVEYQENRRRDREAHQHDQDHHDPDQHHNNT